MFVFPATSITTTTNTLTTTTIFPTKYDDDENSPRAYYYDGRFVFGSDMTGIDHVPDSKWDLYMTMRQAVPKLVVCYSTIRETQDALRAKGVRL